MKRLLFNISYVLGLLFAVLLTNNTAFGTTQLKSSEKKDTSVRVFIVPQFIFSKALRVDIDYKLKPKKWLQSALYLYGGAYSSNNNHNVVSELDRNADLGDDEVIGIGLSLTKKNFLDVNKSEGMGWYLNYGIFGHLLDFNYETFTWVEFEDNNNTMLEYRVAESRQTTLRYGGLITFGNVFKPYPESDVLFDFYYGLGFNNSNILYDENPNKRSYDRRSWSPAGKGSWFTIGFRIGIPISS